MGVIKNDAFFSAYRSDQIDLLLAAMAQANPLPSGTDWVAFIDDCRAAQSGAEAAAELAEAWSAHPPYIGANGNWYVYSISAETFVDSGLPSRGENGKSAYESAQDGGYTGTEEQFNQEFSELPVYAETASNSAQSALTNKNLSESYAVGGTNTRTGEDTDNSKYYCELAQAAAEQASVPPVDGVYNVVVADRTVSGAKYALVVYSGRLKLVGVASTTEATDMTLIDATSGKSYTLVANNGRLLLEEV